MSGDAESLRERFFAAAPRYEYLETLGAGRSGEVFRVFDLDLEEEVALKVLSPASCADPASFERVKREIAQTRRVKHPNVIRLYEFSRAGSLPFVTMEFVDGRDLERILESEGRLDAARSLAILRQVTFGLAAAHARGIAHRDLRPSKVVVDSSGGVVVVGFGLARGPAGGDAPGPAADVAAAGVLALRMLCGWRPSSPAGALAGLDAHARACAVPDALADVVRRCLDPASRFAGAPELYTALAVAGPTEPPDRRTRAVPVAADRRAPAAPPVVLVVDDDEDLLRLLSGHLAREGFQVRTAGDGVEAARALAERTFDAVLLDIWMPKADGFDVLRAVRERPGPRAPVVIMSASLDRGQVAYAFRMGAADVLEKPLDLPALGGRLHRLVAIHRGVEAPR